MGLFGTMQRGARSAAGLMDTRTEEEKQAEAARMLNPLGQQAKPASFWGGGEKFGVRDGLAGLMAVVGDAFSRQGGGQGGAVQMLAGGRNEAVERARKAQEQAQLVAAAGRRGIGADDVALAQGGLGSLLPKPPGPNDTERDYELIRQRVGEEAALQYLRNIGDPMATVNLPGNRVYSGPRSGLGAALGASQQTQGAGADAVPTTEDGYSYTPGPGGRANSANWKPAGGPSQPATGGFPYQR